MTNQNNAPVNFIAVPATFITGASLTTINGAMRLTLIESDNHTQHARGCFVATNEVWALIADLIQKQQALVAEAAKTAALEQSAQARPN